ncbi:hypothetical protein ACVIIV_003459 [Bradyrhizobium sp. USDA 4354]
MGVAYVHHDTCVLASSSCQLRERDGQRAARSTMGPRVFVAGGRLAVRCAQLASDMGCVIRAALCADPIFGDWARRGNIRRVASVEELSTLLNAQVVDWIFSLCNPFALAADVLGRVRQGAFKCREGPLARCAGTAATSTVLLVQDTEYAVTWHRIDGGADTGDRVVQFHVLITPTDTASTLDLKCCEAGVKGFRERLTVLARGEELSACPQALDTPTRVSRTSTSGCGGLPAMGSTRARSLRDNDRLDFRSYRSNRSMSEGCCRNQVLGGCRLTARAYRRALSLSLSLSLLEITPAIGVWRQVRRMLMFGSAAQMVGLCMRGRSRGISAWI